jgi:chromosome segregation ATPase
MPFAIIAPMTPQQQEPEPIETISKEEVDALRSQIIHLKEKNEEWQMQHFRDQGDIKILKRERDEKEKEIQACQKKIKDVKANEEKFKNGLASADENLKAKNENIRLMEYSNKNLYDAGSTAMKAQGEWKQKYEEKVQKL